MGQAIKVLQSNYHASIHSKMQSCLLHLKHICNAQISIYICLALGAGLDSSPVTQAFKHHNSSTIILVMSAGLASSPALLNPQFNPQSY